MLFLFYFLTAFLVSLLIVPFVILFAKKVQIMDIPDERKIHSLHTPLLGGIGIFAAYITVLIMNGIFDNQTAALLVANTVIVVLGFLDDTKGLSAKRKLIGQFIASSIIVFFTSYRFMLPDIGLPILQHPIVTISLTYLWLIGISNAINLIDGMDGLAAGITIMAFGAMGYVASTKGMTEQAIICFSLMGATLGFLRYNLPPAKVFMGDTGSLFLGFSLGVMSLAVAHKSATILSFIIPILFLSLPIFDTLLSIVRRSLKGQNPLFADKGHLHHRLLDLRFSTSQALMIFYAFTLVLCTTTIFVFKKQILWGAISILGLLYIFLFSLKLSLRFSLGDKIRLINFKLFSTIEKLREQNDRQLTLTNVLNTASVIISIYLISYFVFTTGRPSANLKSSLTIFSVALFLSVIYRYFSTIVNHFIAFAYYWVLFFALYNLYGNTGYDSNVTAALITLTIVLVIKMFNKHILISFLSNPMEIMIVFFQLLLFLYAGMPASDYIKICVTSYITYYSTKEVFAAKVNTCMAYSSILVALCFFYILR